MDKDNMTHTPGDGNRIIAEFMAVKIEEDTNRIYYLLPNMTTETKTGWYQVERMQYHTSWDWLMKVVEKIETMGWCHVIAKLISDEQRSHFINYHTGEEICGSRTDSKLTAIYSSVLEFINWYNTNRFQTNDR